MPDYVRAQQTARRLIGDAGRSISIVKLGGLVDLNDLLGDKTADDIIPDIKAAFVDPSSNTALGFSIQRRELFAASEAICLIAHDGTNDLREFDRIIDNGKTLVIDHVEALAPGDLTILYFVGVKSP